MQNPSVRYVNNSVNLTCEFAEGSTAEGCIFNFTGVTSQQSFFVNRSGDSDVASRCEITRAFANNTDYIWNAFDNVGEVPVTVELIAVDSQDENNFTCLLLLSGRHMQSLIPRPYSTLPLCIHIKRRVLLLLFSLHLFSCLLFVFFSFPPSLPLSCIIVKAYTSKIGGDKAKVCIWYWAKHMWVGAFA